MTLRILKFAAWLCLGFIVFVTVSPIGFRPGDPLPVNLDRALAFAVMAGLFVFAYPRHWLMVLVLSVAGAGLIELLQHLSPSRHAHLSDALVKAGGALLGVLIAAAWNRHRGRGSGGSLSLAGIETD